MDLVSVDLATMVGGLKDSEEVAPVRLLPPVWALTGRISGEHQVEVGKQCVACLRVHILDEPTAGLHPFDMLRLLDALNALVDRGHSVIVIEHSPEVMVCADWIIDLGPGAGAEGGRIVAAGIPEDVARSGTLTGAVIAAALGKSGTVDPA